MCQKVCRPWFFPIAVYRPVQSLLFNFQECILHFYKTPWLLRANSYLFFCYIAAPCDNCCKLPVFIYFYSHIGSWIARRRTQEVQERYKMIGGGSPIFKWTDLQGRLLCKKLDQSCPETAPHRHYIAFRYSKPFTEDAMYQLERLVFAKCHITIILTIAPLTRLLRETIWVNLRCGNTGHICPVRNIPIGRYVPFFRFT